MKYLSILTVLFLLAYQGKNSSTEPAQIRNNAIHCFIDANSGDGTDQDISNAIDKAAEVYSLDSAEYEALLTQYYL